MKIRVFQEAGCAKESDAKLLKRAVKAMLRELVDDEHLVNVRLDIVIAELERDCGEIELQDAPRFLIRLAHDLDTILTILTLAHELVHLSQVLTGRLRLNESSARLEWVWEGVNYGEAPYASPKIILPWEEEAKRLEANLTRHFLASYVSNLNNS